MDNEENVPFQSPDDPQSYEDIDPGVLPYRHNAPEEDDEDIEAAVPPVTDDPAKKASEDHFLTGYKELEAQLAAKQREIAQYQRLIEDMGSNSARMQEQAEKEAFLSQVRQSYEKDPVDAVRMMLDKAQGELWDAMEQRIGLAFDEQVRFKRLLGDFLSDPQNTVLKPYEEEMEFLIREKRLPATEAADLLRRIDSKRLAARHMRSEAASRIRKRSAMENGGETRDTVDKDREFYRVMKKARTLDDMFAGLRKLGGE